MQKTFLKLAEGTGAVHAFDTIEYRGARWIVPAWQPTDDGQFRTPRRLIGLHGVEHESFEFGGARSFYVSSPLPASLLFEHPLPPELHQRYDVIELAN